MSADMVAGEVAEISEQKESVCGVDLAWTAAGKKYLTNPLRISDGKNVYRICHLKSEAAQTEAPMWYIYEKRPVLNGEVSPPPIGWDNFQKFRYRDKCLGTPMPSTNQVPSQEDEGYPSPPTSALSIQQGGDHYKNLPIQPVEYIHANDIPFIEGCVIKYVTRWRSKAGIADLQKAKHFIDLLIELESKKGSQL